jgi:hypothetical protein
MTQRSEGPGNMRRGASDFRIRSQGVTPNDPNLGVRRTSTGRRIVPVDTGAVALAVTGMAFYWMPILAGRRRPKRRPTPANPPTDATPSDQ